MTMVPENGYLHLYRHLSVVCWLPTRLLWRHNKGR